MQRSFTLILVLFISFAHQLAAQDKQADIIENALSSVVTVAVYETNMSKKTLGFRGGSPNDIAYAKMLNLSGASGSGSGFVIEKNGQKYVVTNSHVIDMATGEDGSVAVYSISRRKYNARIIGGDTFYDIAVLEFIDAPGKEITTMAFRPEEARVGEPVFAIGNPLGEYPYSVSEGIISAKNRTRGGLTGKFGFLQSTATVIWGNSGGPLIDKAGKVVGINSQIAFAENGGQTFWQSQINFALEANLSNRLVNDIIDNNGLIKRSYLGIEVGKNKLGVSNQDPNYWNALDMLAGENHPTITGVVKGSPAEKVLANKIGYCIAAINGNETRNTEEVLGELENIRAGAPVKLSIHRGSQKEEVTFTTAPLNYSRSADLSLYMATKNGWNLKQEENAVTINFGAPASAKANRQVNINPFYPQEAYTESLAGEWVIVGVGMFDENQENIWRVEEIADLATATRLTSMSGIVDLVLMRKGSDPLDAESYLKKRIFFAENDYLLKETLLY